MFPSIHLDSNLSRNQGVVSAAKNKEIRILIVKETFYKQVQKNTKTNISINVYNTAFT